MEQRGRRRGSGRRRKSGRRRGRGRRRRRRRRPRADEEEEEEEAPPVNADEVGEVLRPHAVRVVHNQHRGLRSKHDVEVLGVRASAVARRDHAPGKQLPGDRARGMNRARHLIG